MARRILFVDDEFAPDTVDAFGSYMSMYELDLRDANFDVTRSTNVDEAILLVKSERFDLAILDVMMPPGDAFKDDDTMKGLQSGLFLARKLRLIESQLPIFLLSNAAENRELFGDVLNDNVVDRVLFKLDVTPGNLVQHVESFFAGGEDA